VCALDGRQSVSAQGAAPATLEEAVALGERVGAELLARGAGAIIAERRAAASVEEP